MLKKLRLRFVGINMAIVLVILCTIFGVLLHTTHANLERESVDMITAVAADPLQLNWPDTASRLPYFTVRISPYGSVRVSGTSYYDLSDEQVLSGIVTAALRSGGYYLTEEGLALWFPQESLAPRNAGLPTVLLPYAALEGLLRFSF